MRRALVLLLVVIAALAATGPPAAGATPRRGMYLRFRSGGFYVQVNSELGSGRARLYLDRHGEVAYYYVPARLGAGTVRARFGRLGSLDLRFAPARREGALGCDGRLGRGWQRGSFRGSFVFDGEHHYVRIDRDRIPGYFRTRPTVDCRGRRGSGAAPAATASRAHGVAETGAELYGRTSSRTPRDEFYVFTDARPGGLRVAYEAFRVERREGMVIERGGSRFGGAAGFVWNLGAGTAKVEAPAPFSGRAFFRRNAGGRSSWTGSLRVPILGGKPVRLTGSIFNPHLGPAA